MKLKYNSKEVDRSKAELSPPKPGVYRMVIEAVNEKKRTGQSDMLEFVLRMQVADGDGNGKGYGFWDNVAVDLDWKVDQYLVAVGIDTEANPEGVIDTNKTFLGKTVMGRVRSDTWNNEYKPKLGAVLPFVEGDDETDYDATSEFETEGGEDESETEELDDSTSDDPTEEDVADLGVNADDGDEDSIAHLDRLGRAAGLEPDEYATWGELAAAIIETMVPAEKPKPVKATAKKAAAKPKAAPEPEPDTEGDDQDYDSWELNDLKAEARSRDISDKGPMSAIIARLRKADADPFAED